MALSPGTRLGPYDIVASLGAGGMGEVYRARDARLGRDVAIKALPAGFAASGERLSRFRREAQTLAALNHPNIATIYGLEEHDGAPHLILELVVGETLAERLTRGALSAHDALAICVQIAAAIEAAHERGIVHRDLKPGNVMIARNGAVKVLDFGLATNDTPDAAHGATMTLGASMSGAIVGTAAYMSPEQARGKSVDRRSDVWSFGCVLYECFAGRPAFGGDTPSDIIARLLEREPEWSALPAHAPPRVREIMRRCMRRDADARPRDIRDVRIELAEVAAGGEKGAARREDSIAVLPFVNMSGPDDEYFADGVTGEIMNALVHVEGLRVAARTSCFAFKGRSEDSRAIGENLDVATLLEGTVRRAGTRLRITAQLVNASDGYQLWSERYDREMTDVFAVQDEIAAAIATRLRGALQADAGRARRGTNNLEAYELLARGRGLQTKRGRFMAQAVACFEHAIALDPNYADALALLADSYRLMAVFGAKAPRDVMPKAKELAARALAIDPESVDAFVTLGAVAEQWEFDYARSDEWYGRALALDPRNAQARSQRCLWRVVRGVMHADEGIAEMRRAVQDDPLNAWVGGMHSYMLSIADRHEEAIEEADRAVALDPDSFFPHWNLMRQHAWTRGYDRALAEAPSLLDASGRHCWALGLLAWTHGRAGDTARAHACFDEMEARSRHQYVQAAWISIAAGAAHELDAAMEWLARAVDEREAGALWARALPFFAPHRTHARFPQVTHDIWVGGNARPLASSGSSSAAGSTIASTDELR